MKKIFSAITGFLAEVAQSGVLYASGFGAALSVALGKFILGGFLAVLCAGIVLRFKRGRVVANPEIKKS